MKTYIGIKQVQAEPMNELTAVEKGLARPNKDNHEWREGYHVVYPDGYESWSPRSVFNEAYKPADTPYERMIIESCELAKKNRKTIRIYGVRRFPQF